MKISSVKVDPIKVEQGEWVKNIPELSGVRLKVRGSNNKDWRRLQQRMFAAVPRNKRTGGMPVPEELDRINGVLILEAGLLDWDGLENDDGSPISYSKDQAKEYLTNPEFVAFRDGALWACQQAGAIVDEDIKDTSGN